MVSREERAAIRARLDAATPGEWVAEEGAGANPDRSCWVEVRNRATIAEQSRWADADLIAHAPTDLAALLDALDEAERWRSESEAHAAAADDAATAARAALDSLIFLLNNPSDELVEVIARAIYADPCTHGRALPTHPARRCPAARAAIAAVAQHLLGESRAGGEPDA